ncbi:FAD-dependent oxidoreductase [Streptomyces hirsutus]|uniref:FAD-dependent oxidoreductase n=1 Tax=Streptomyces hirsutus TaxID=35620 RepID=UPI0036C5E943
MEAVVRAEERSIRRVSSPPDTIQTDVAVLGTGAAGLTAALAASIRGASVTLIEKASTIGGTSALSGGQVWLPANPRAVEAGIADSVEDGIRYYRSLSHGLLDEDLVRTLVETGPKLVDWLDTSTSVRLLLVPGYPDYHPENPGGMPKGGRTLEPGLFSFVRLGEWATRITPSWLESRMLLQETPFVPGAVIPNGAEMQRREAEDIHAMGPALVGALLADLLERDIVPRTNSRATELIMKDGRVVGLLTEENGELIEVRTNRGVVIATGGFDWDPDLVKSFLRGPMAAPISFPENTGDGLKMAMRAGASLGTMAHAWWMPCIKLSDDGHFGRVEYRMTLNERAYPGSIMVNRKGERFVNEASSYNALGGALHQFDSTRFEYANLPCWIVIDQACLENYGFPLGGVRPGDPAPEWMASGDTLTALAEEIGVPADRLNATVNRFNDLVDGGRDLDFGRGESAYDLWNGDNSRTGTKITLGRLDTGPYHAVEVHSGTLGTKGGPRTNGDAQVLDVEGRPIPGLYAAGNAMAGTTGMVYGGAGGTLGPAMVFGYRAGLHSGSSCH